MAGSADGVQKSRSETIAYILSINDDDDDDDADLCLRILTKDIIRAVNT
jgi:hypothetical protein